MPIACLARPIWPRAFALCAVCVLALSLNACWWDKPQQLPNLAFTELDGTPHRTAEFKGKVTLVHFWATSCAVCLAEMPRLVSTYGQFKAQGLGVLAVAMVYDPPAYVMHYAELKKLPFRVAMDHTGELAQTLGPVDGTPTTLVVNKNGDVVKRYVGEPDFAALHALLRQLLAEHLPSGAS